MADSVFIPGRLVCNRAPGTCRVNASETCDGYYARACFLLPPTSSSSLLSIVRARGFAMSLFLGIKDVEAFDRASFSEVWFVRNSPYDAQCLNHQQIRKNDLGEEISTYDERVLGKRQIRWQWIVGATV